MAPVRSPAPATTPSVGGNIDAAQITAQLVETAQDRVDYSVYDAAARLVFRVQGDATVQEIRYDAIGRVRATLAYAVAVDATLMSQLVAGTATQAGFAGHVSANEATARVEGLHYDQAGRVRYQVMRSGVGLGQATETQYDAIGRVVAKTRYGVDIAYAPGATTASVGSAVSAVFDGRLA
jgi:hypothetical protein